MSVQFSHIMSGGYAAGYYSYKWAEVLEADAFSLFLKNGIMDRQTAQRFRNEILSRGGTEPPLELYKRFRGQEPTIDALLRRNGLPDTKQNELDILKSIGALIGDPTCEFRSDENSTNDMLNGDFVWHILVTVTPQMKSATGKVTYTDEGFSALFGEEG